MPNVPREEVYGMRNRLVHDYTGILPEMVWEVVETDLDFLENEIVEYQKRFHHSNN